MAGIKFSEGLRVGKVGFINTLPIFHPLESGAVRHDFQIIEGTPVELNGLLAAGKLDLGLVSSVEYGRRFEKYLLLPDLSISCTNKVCSVLLLSRVALEELNDQEILLTPKSETSVALLRLLFSRHFAVQPRYRIADYHVSDSRWPGGSAAVLAIGDDALRLRNNPEVKLAFDLGEAWYEWTGHPFVFAVWAVRSETLAQRDGEVHRAHATLLQARDYGLKHLDKVSEPFDQCTWFSQKACNNYLQTIEYDLDVDKQAGLILFFDMLCEMGELDRRVALSFLPAADQRANPR